MDQILCPFPKMIPVPKDDLLLAMNECGIKTHGKTYKFNDSNEEFIEYTLPSGWHIINKSSRNDFLDYYFIDENRMVRFYICGIWKGFYDNRLFIYVIENPYPIT